MTVEGPCTIMVDLHSLIVEEIRGHLFLYDADYASTQYVDLARDDEIEKFLRGDPSYDYDAQEWVGIATIETEQELYSRMRNLVALIISTFGPPAADGGTTREVCCTNYAQLPHVDDQPVYGGSTPAMVIRASGPSFQDPLSSNGSDTRPLGYSNAASCFHIIPEFFMKNEDPYYAEQSAIFARQMFIQQPNRRFVRNLLITDEICHLYHFDRSGGQYTAAINIHQYPEIFIRLVLGLSSPDEAVLGFDTSVRWEVVNGRRTSGTITVTDASGSQTVFDLCELEPVFRRYEICGRATKGWHARAQDGREVFVKDYWRPEGATPEYSILEAVIGVDGAAQLITYESQEVSTGAIRSHGSSNWSLEGFKNLISTRIVTEFYGKPLRNFESQRQLVAAFRDTIRALSVIIHERDVLHRDISGMNILLGRHGARVGQRGVLVDFEMGIKGPRPATQSPTDPKHGTFLYESISLLKSYSPQVPCSPAHNQFDDLESVYYLLYELMCTFTGVGKQLEEFPWHLQRWNDRADPYRCGDIKAGHWLLRNPRDIKHVTPFWLPATLKLLTGFYKTMRETVHWRHNLVELKTPADMDELKELLTTSRALYDEVLAHFDTALEELKVEEPADDTPSADEMDVNDRPPSRIPSRIPSKSPSPPPPNDKPPSLKRPCPLEPLDESLGKKRARVAIPVSYSPPRTRSKTRAALLVQSIAAPPTPPLGTAPAPPRTRSQTKAAAMRAAPQPAPPSRPQPTARSSRASRPVAKAKAKSSSTSKRRRV